jgi:hypothetical protein
MYSWSTAELVKAVVGPEPAEEVGKGEHREKVSGVRNFLVGRQSSFDR